MKISYSPFYWDKTYYVGIRRHYFSLSEVLAAAIICLDVSSKYDIEFIRNDSITSISNPLSEMIVSGTNTSCSVSAWEKHSFNILDSIYTKHLGLPYIPQSIGTLNNNILTYLNEIETALSKLDSTFWSFERLSCPLSPVLADFIPIFEFIEEVNLVSKQNFDKQNEIFDKALEWMQKFLCEKLVAMTEEALV